ncbi:MAG: hypothetical protein ACRDZN_12970 [Acidimicrobiales bacterium]
MGEPRDNGSDERPWASLLDPAANARALGEIQRRGLRAAGDLVDRIIGAVDDGSAAPPSSASAPAEHSGAVPNGASSPGADLVQIWVDLFQRGLQAVTGAARPNGLAPAAGDRAVTADLATGATTGALHIRAGAAPSAGVPDGLPDGLPDARDTRDTPTASGEVWLHNGTGAPIAGLRPHSGELRAHDGATLPASAIGFDPPSLDELPARSSRGVVVEVRLGGGVAAGVYRGVVLVAGAPDVWLPLLVTVDDHPAGGTGERGADRGAGPVHQ